MKIYIVLEFSEESGPGSSPTVTPYPFASESSRDAWVSEWNMRAKEYGAEPTTLGWWYHNRSHWLTEHEVKIIGSGGGGGSSTSAR